MILITLERDSHTLEENHRQTYSHLRKPSAYSIKATSCTLATGVVKSNCHRANTFIQLEDFQHHCKKCNSLKNITENNH